MNNKNKKKLFYFEFKKILILCFLFLVLDQIMPYIENLDELFNGANIIFQIFKCVVSVNAVIAGSVFAAVVFYYITIFLEARRETKKYAEQLELLLDSIDNIISDIMPQKSVILKEYYFEKNNAKDLFERKYLYKFIDEFKKIYVEKKHFYIYHQTEYYDLKDDLVNWIKYVYEDDYMKTFEKEKMIHALGLVKNALNIQVNYCYNKSDEDFEKLKYYRKNLKQCLNTIDKKEITDFWNEENWNLFYNAMADSMFDYFFATINTYEKILKYYICLQNKKILTFIKMV